MSTSENLSRNESPGAKEPRVDVRSADARNQPSMTLMPTCGFHEHTHSPDWLSPAVRAECQTSHQLPVQNKLRKVSNNDRKD